jgi:hypothetical protein
MRVQTEFAPAGTSCDYFDLPMSLTGLNHLCVTDLRDPALSLYIVSGPRRSTTSLVSAAAPVRR